MLIDTRTAEEFSFGTIPGAINIPVSYTHLDVYKRQIDSWGNQSFVES